MFLTIGTGRERSARSFVETFKFHRLAGTGLSLALAIPTSRADQRTEQKKVQRPKAIVDLIGLECACACAC